MGRLEGAFGHWCIDMRFTWLGLATEKTASPARPATVFWPVISGMNMAKEEDSNLKESQI